MNRRGAENAEEGESEKGREKGGWGESEKGDMRHLAPAGRHVLFV